MTHTVTIESLGHRGEGIAEIEAGRVYVPFTLAGETVTIEAEGERGTLLDVLQPSQHRATPFCPHFGVCGGCQLQHLDMDTYQAFKSGLIETALRQVGIDAPVERFIDASGAGRRRATLHARRDAAGYMRQRSHELLDIDHCPILVPALARAPEIARAIGATVGACDVSFTSTETGIDVTIRNPQKGARLDRLISLANQFGLARIAHEREMIALRQMPVVTMGAARIELPMGSFLQATSEAETRLADYVVNAVGKAKKVADLFCGVGPFALRLAEGATVLATDADKPAIEALDKGFRHARGLKVVTARYRDLFRDPLTRFELDVDCVVLDPPRAGAAAQVKELAASRIGHVVMVACDPRTFARDAATLVGAGFTLSDLVALDQFAWSTHIEVAATFRR